MAEYIDDTAKVASDAEVGAGSMVWRNCQVRSGADIGQDCVLSKDVYIGVDVTIGSGCKIQNGVSVFEGVTLEDDVFCGPHMTFTNDRNIRINPDTYEPIPTHVEKGAAIGAHATVLPGVTICKYAMVGAQSLVSKDVPPFGLVYGNPSRIQGVVCYCGHKLSDVAGIKEREEFKCAECGKVVRIDKHLFADHLNL